MTFIADANITLGPHILRWKGHSVESKWCLNDRENILKTYVTEQLILCANVIVYSGVARGSV